MDYFLRINVSLKVGPKIKKICDMLREARLEVEKIILIFYVKAIGVL